MTSAKSTTDHDEIQRWVEARGGYPARVKRTGGGDDPGILRIDYPGYSGQDTLQRIEWNEFFDWFDRDHLAFLYQDSKRSRFSKLVDRGSTKRAPARKRTAATKKRPAAKRVASTTKKRPAAKKAASTKKRSAATTKKRSAATATKKRPSAKRTSTTKKRTTSTGGRTSRSAKQTRDHDTIRKWVEARGGWPATVIGTETGAEEAGLLRIDYPGYSGQGTLERIDWDDFFDKFDEENLTFLYQNTPRSRFSKFVRS